MIGTIDMAKRDIRNEWRIESREVTGMKILKKI